MMERFDAEGTLRLVEQHRATWLYTVPNLDGVRRHLADRLARYKHPRSFVALGAIGWVRWL